MDSQLQEVVRSAIRNSIKKGDELDEILKQCKEIIEQETNAAYADEPTRNIDELERLAYYDILAGCWNRNCFEVRRTTYDTKHMVIALVDIDSMKVVNDSFGHIAGDRYLRHIVDQMHEEFRQVFRLGGDEFLILTTRHSKSTTEQILSRIDGISFGVFWKHTNVSMSDVMAAADRRMYASKVQKKLERMKGHEIARYSEADKSAITELYLRLQKEDQDESI